MKKVNIFCHSFQKAKRIYNSLDRMKYVKPLFIEIFDYGLHIMKTQNSVSQKIWILHKINKKRIF